MTSDNNNNQYINTTDYKKLENKLTEIKGILDDKIDQTVASRRLRYAEVDIEIEREAGRIGPDELYVPVHTIETNIRREQVSYVQYVVQSKRAVVCEDQSDDTVDLQLLEKDLTKKLRFDNWQQGMLANIDGFQAFGYGFLEIVYDPTAPGHVIYEQVQNSDFAFVADTRDTQACEFVARTFHYTKTKLIALCGDPKNPKEGSDWSREQVDKVIANDSSASASEPLESNDEKDKSLYRVQKIMFRVNGTVQVAWTCIGTADDWVRAPRPLYIGERKINTEVQQAATLTQNNPSLLQQIPGVKPSHIDQIQKGLPPSDEVYETEFPYIQFQYLISENDTIDHLKGRIFLDQDAQEGITSLLSSTLTRARRSAGMYGSKDTDDPNDDILMQSNVYFKPNCLINKKVTFSYLPPPEPGMLSAIQMLQASNQQETSQVNFAESNKQSDSRKTAAAIKESRNQRQELTGTQVVLFSLAMGQLYRKMVKVIVSRVLCGIIKVSPALQALYQRDFVVKPSGDVDVIERDDLLQKMQAAWPMLQQTAAGPLFLCDMLELLFPDTAPKYIQAIQQQQQQQQSQQAQQQQQMLQFAMQMGKGIVELSKHTDWFSDIGKLHAVPIIEQYANKILSMKEQMTGKQ